MSQECWLALDDGLCLEGDSNDAFSAKAGGCPVWPSTAEIPAAVRAGVPETDRRCGICGRPFTLLFQINCAADEIDRLIFIFACSSASCTAQSPADSWKVYRCSLPALADGAADSEPLDVAPQLTPYCVPPHYLDLSEAPPALPHGDDADDLSDADSADSDDSAVAAQCALAESLNAASDVAPTFTEEVATEFESVARNPRQSGDAHDEGVDEHAIAAERSFRYFARTVAQAPQQLLRWHVGGPPLLLRPADGNITPPPCGCGRPRRFELQKVMPATIWYLFGKGRSGPSSEGSDVEALADTLIDYANPLDFGTAYIYLCSDAAGCGVGSYREEYVVVAPPVS